MTTTAKAFLVLFALGAILAAWMGRLSTTHTGTGFGVIVTDRWTGTVYDCGGGVPCQAVYPK